MITINAKAVPVEPVATVTITSLNSAHPINDNPGAGAARTGRCLTISVNGRAPILRLKDAEYDAFYERFGQSWTDENINTVIVEKLGLTVAPE